MQSNISYKTPINSRRNWLNKSNSLSYLIQNSSNKKVYKIRERLYSPNTLSILSSKKNEHKFNSNFNNFKTNYFSMMKNLILNDVALDEEKKSGIKSLDNLFNSITHLKKNISKKNNFFEQKKVVEENNYENYENKVQNIISHKKNKKINRQLILGKRLFFSEKKNKNEKKIFFDENTNKIPVNILLPHEGKKDSIANLKLVNQILKFNKASTKIGNNIKDISPMKLGKNYDKFVEKKIKLIYNPNFNSPNIHRMSINFMIDNITKNMIRKSLYLKNLEKKESKKYKEKKKKLNMELMEEMKDKVEDISFDLENIKKNIKIYLTDETKLNQISDIKEEFYDKFENKINFLFDCIKFPIIKNNLNKIKIDTRSAIDIEWSKLNLLENCTLVYLNKLKTKLQRELDEIDVKENKEKEKQFRLYRDIGKFEEKKKKNNKNKKKKKNESDFMDETNTSIDYIINLMKSEIKMKKEETEETREKENSEKEDMYDLEEFFVHKSRPYKKIDFANEKLTYIIYHKKEFYESNTIKKSDTIRKSLPNVFI